MVPMIEAVLQLRDSGLVVPLPLRGTLQPQGTRVVTSELRIQRCHFLSLNTQNLRPSHRRSTSAS